MTTVTPIADDTRWHRSGSLLTVEHCCLIASAIRSQGRWVLREACRQVARWQAAWALDPPLVLSVNLSPRQLADPELGAVVAAILAESVFPAAQLWLELTETALLMEQDGACRTLEALASLGVQRALDDFGTGYSSLMYLRQFPMGMR